MIRSRRSHRVEWLVCVAVALGLAPEASAQEPAATLTLEEAISLARQNNPTFRATANDEGEADWQVREAYSAFLPALSTNSQMSYQAPGTPQAFGVFTAEDLGLGRTPESYTSRYGINLGMTLSPQTFFGVAQAKANARSTEARIDAAAYTLSQDVTRQYLAVLRGRDGVAIAQSALESAQQAQMLAQARMDVGEATRLDVGQAEVDLGRAEVGVIQAENTYETEKLRLMQQIGVSIDRDIELTSTFEVFEPTWTVEELEAYALDRHPQLQSIRAAEDAARASARAATLSYLPTIQIFGGWSGFVRRTGSDAYVIEQARENAVGRIENCQFWNHISAGLSNGLPGFPEDCGGLALTPAQEQAVVAANNRFPFDYTTNPASFVVTVNLPIFDGFTRERQMQTARAAADDARHQRRAEELNRRTEVATNLLALNAAYRTVALEQRNAERAGVQLELSRERYRLGAVGGSILELTQAQEQKVRADQAYLDALYTFHESLASLEAAVGRALR